MSLRKVILAAALGGCFGSVWAADQVVDLSSGQASFIGSAPLLDGGDDVISFTNLAAGTYDVRLTMSSQDILDLSATLNGVAASVFGYDEFRFAGLKIAGDSPFVLSISGTTSALSSYSGEFTAVAAVPEPETYALMLAGLAAVGFMARRRRQAQ